MIKSRRMRWEGHATCMGKDAGCAQDLVGKPEGKKPHGRHRCRWDDNIQEVECGGMDWIDLSQGMDR